MKNTSEKELDILVPLPLIHSIHDGLRSYERTRLIESASLSELWKQHCDNDKLTINDFVDYQSLNTHTRVLAVVITVLIIEDGLEEVPVTVQWYWCKHCDKPVDADMSELFYEDCLYGKPIR